MKKYQVYIDENFMRERERWRKNKEREEREKIILYN